MQQPIDVYLEVVRRRTFASALDWPGFTRSGRDEPGALAALVAAGGRYRAAIGATGAGFAPPLESSGFLVVERVAGNATTEFGAPGVAAPSDNRPIDDEELDRLSGLLRACWSAFDASAAKHEADVLRTGPRGGGRDLAAIVAHVDGADRAYLGALGGALVRARAADGAADSTRALRDAFLGALRDRAHGVPAPPSRRRNPVWAPRYAIRRSAWHALDHAWEIEDRATD